MAEGAAFCSNCGQGFSVMARPAAPVMAMTNVPAYGGAPVAAVGPQVEYAGFWLRVLAFVIDNIVAAVGIVAVLVPLVFLTGLGTLLSHINFEEEMSDAGIMVIVGLIFLGVVATIVVTWLYHALMESSEWQATVGKRLVGLVVTDMAGQRVSFWRASGRHFGKIITNMLPLFIGYFLAAFTERRQALHDMIAGCVILRRSL